MRVIVVANQKGGVGKSTTVAHLAAEFGLQGFRTLLVAADPQVNASAFFMRPDDIERGLETVLIRRGNGTSTRGVESTPRQDSPKVGLLDIAIQTEIPKLLLVPSTGELANYDNEGNLSILRLKHALDDVGAHFDFCFVDTPPTLGMMLSAALAAADYVLIPCQSEPFAVEGLSDLMVTIEAARELNRNIEIAGACVTMHDRRTNLAAAIKEGLAERFSEYTFESVIHRQIKLTEASAAHRPVQLYAPQSPGARDYRALALEMMRRFGVEPPAAAEGLPAEVAQAPAAETLPASQA